MCTIWYGVWCDLSGKGGQLKHYAYLALHYTHIFSKVKTKQKQNVKRHVCQMMKNQVEMQVFWDFPITHKNVGMVSFLVGNTKLITEFL